MTVGAGEVHLMIATCARALGLATRMESEPPLQSGLPPTRSGLPDALAEIELQLRRIRRKIQEAQKVVLPVVGSGLSKGLPSWRDLIDTLLSCLPPTERRAVVKSASAADCLASAEVVANSCGPQKVAAIIRELYAEPPVPRPEVMDLLVALPLTQFATTNFDHGWWRPWQTPGRSRIGWCRAWTARAGPGRARMTHPLLCISTDPPATLDRVC
jgi:hypothetical protein